MKDYFKDISLNYAANGKSVAWRIECKSDISKLLVKTMNLESRVEN